MSYEPVSDPTCEVCGRRLLPGERETPYASREGQRVSVCELCKPRAEAAGWTPADRDLHVGATGRERRRGRGADLFGGFFGKRSRPPTPTRPTAADPARAGAAVEPERRLADADLSVASALAAFNRSNHRRTVRGLGRTLGTPRASGLLVKTSSGASGARLTVAWELTWYQWEVGSDKGGLEVREAGKGDTIEQLRAADRTWNLGVSDDGTLSEHGGESE